MVRREKFEYTVNLNLLNLGCRHSCYLHATRCVCVFYCISIYHDQLLHYSCCTEKMTFFRLAGCQDLEATQPIILDIVFKNAAD